MTNTATASTATGSGQQRCSRKSTRKWAKLPFGSVERGSFRDFASGGAGSSAVSLEERGADEERVFGSKRGRAAL